MKCRYKSRLFTDLGLNLWIVKLCQSLPAIEAQAASYATGERVNRTRLRPRMHDDGVLVLE